jgi:hypothetical protein
MIICNDIFEGDDKQLAEKSFLGIISSLEKAKNSSRSFFLVSSSFVFDRTINKEYTEGSKPNGKTPSSLFLIEAEKRVLDYSKGYVYRKQDLFSEIQPLIDKMMAFKEEPVFCEESLRILSNEVYNDVLNYAITQSFGEQKILHIAVPTKFPVHTIWFHVKGLPFRISSTNPNFVFKGNIGFISSKILKEFGFYNKFILRNHKEVLSSLGKLSCIGVENDKATNP